MTRFTFDIPAGVELKQNIKSAHILITKDKIENILMKYINKLNIKSSWVTPLGLVLSLGLTFATANFKDFAYISAATWQSVFLIGLILSFGWLVVAVIRVIANRNKYSLTSIIKEFEDGSEN